MEVTRRTVLAGMAAVPAVSLLRLPRRCGFTQQAEAPEVKLTWLEGKPTTAAVTTWGTPWPKGAVPANQSFALKAADGSAVPLQSWPTAYWPDGSLKWSAHAIAVDAPAESYTLGRGYAGRPGAGRSPSRARRPTSTSTPA